MSTTTTNYGLVKPELTDAADITAMNDNWDTLDQVIKENKDEAKSYTDNKFASIPTPDVSGQINTHNSDTSAHSDIRQLASNAQSTADNHVSNKQNPHGVTKSQVGLGNVPNVATNDQTPTYTASSSLTALSSGEKLSVAFGKLAKAVSDLISHIGNKSNPHGVTASQAGAVAKTGDTMTGALDIRHNDGVYTQRTVTENNTNVTYRNQMAVSGRAGKAVINTWKNGSFYGALYIGNNELQYNKIDGSFLNVAMYTASTTDLTAGSSALATNDIRLVYE